MAKKENTSPKSFAQFEEEDFNNIFQTYKIPIISAIILITVSVVGYGMYNKGQAKKNELVANDIFTFRTTVDEWLKPDESGKKTIQPFKKESKEEVKETKTWEQIQPSYAELVSKHGHQSSMSPLVLEIVGKLVKENKKQKAFEIISEHYNSLSSSAPLVKHVVGNYYAGLSEDLGKAEEAIKVKEKMLGMKQKFMEAKTYFDLGRLYKKLGNTSKAKSNFEYLIKNFSKDDIIPLAKVYLSEL